MVQIPGDAARATRLLVAHNSLNEVGQILDANHVPARERACFLTGTSKSSRAVKTAIPATEIARLLGKEMRIRRVAPSQHDEVIHATSDKIEKEKGMESA